MSDLISRQKLLDTIKPMVGMWDEGAFWIDYRRVIDIIEDFPNAEPERKWIPVSEKLPEEEKDVLVSVHFDGYKDEYINYPPSDYVEIASHIDGVWSSIYDDFKTMRRHHHIVEWMPLPEPWRGE